MLHSVSCLPPHVHCSAAQVLQKDPRSGACGNYLLQPPLGTGSVVEVMSLGLVGVGLGIIGGGWESSSTTFTSFSINSLVISGTCIVLSLAATNWGVGLLSTSLLQAEGLCQGTTHLGAQWGDGSCSCGCCCNSFRPNR